MGTQIKKFLMTYTFFPMFGSVEWRRTHSCSLIASAQRVRKKIPSHYEIHRNNNNMTADELLQETHSKQLKDAQKWIKETSQSCSAVAVLVATVVSLQPTPSQEVTILQAVLISSTLRSSCSSQSWTLSPLRALKKQTTHVTLKKKKKKTTYIVNW